jgi:hypothetical protein
MNLVITAPTIEMVIKYDESVMILDGRILVSRQIPYPPSLRSTAAKIMLPATGASTWALGSHRWQINIGSFTKNPLIIRMYMDLGIVYS